MAAAGVFAPFAVAPRASVPFVGSVGRASVPTAASALRLHSSSASADALFPAAVGASGVPDSAWLPVYLAVVGISCRSRSYPSEGRYIGAVALRLREYSQWVVCPSVREPYIHRQLPWPLQFLR